MDNRIWLYSAYQILQQEGVISHPFRFTTFSDCKDMPFERRNEASLLSIGDMFPDGQQPSEEDVSRKFHEDIEAIAFTERNFRIDRSDCLDLLFPPTKITFLRDVIPFPVSSGEYRALSMLGLEINNGKLGEHHDVYLGQDFAVVGSVDYSYNLKHGYLLGERTAILSEQCAQHRKVRDILPINALKPREAVNVFMAAALRKIR